MPPTMPSTATPTGSTANHRLLALAPGPALKIDIEVKCSPKASFTCTYGSAQATMMSTAAAIATTPAATLMREAAAPASRAALSAGSGGTGARPATGAPHRLQNWLPSAISAAHVGHFTARPPRDE